MNLRVLARPGAHLVYDAVAVSDDQRAREHLTVTFGQQQLGSRAELPQDLGIVIHGIGGESLALAGLRDQLSERRQAGIPRGTDVNSVPDGFADELAGGRAHPREELLWCALQID